MSRNKGRGRVQFRAPHRAGRAHHRRVDKLPFPCPNRVPKRLGGARAARTAALALLALAAAGPAAAQAPRATDRAAPGAGEASLSTEVAAQVRQLVVGAATIVWGSAARAPRIEVEVGRLDPRLRLAPCQQVVPYLPAGTRPLGRTRVGLRCAQGPQAWNVSLSVVVRLWAPALTAATALPAGTVLAQGHLVSAEVDLAERADPAITQPADALGRTLSRGLDAGAALRRGDLATRQLFASGDTVRIVAVGPGYAVSSEGRALGPGLEGQTARVRTENGRIVSGRATAERLIEVTL